MRTIGFDLGDGESAVALLAQDSALQPRMFDFGGTHSVLSAVGLLDGEIVIGDAAYLAEGVQSLCVRFKSRFLDDKEAAFDLERFARGVLDALVRAGVSLDDAQVIVGCPAGWDAAARSRYRGLLTRAGFPGVSIVTESRAAFLYARGARDIQADPALLRENTLVVDIGSSTTDFAYIVKGREQGIGTFGNVRLGGGVLDACILREALLHSPDRRAIEAVFRECPSWYSYCEVEARKLKEIYFSNESAWSEDAPCTRTVRIYYDTPPLTLPLRLTPGTIQHILGSPVEALGERSFRQTLGEALCGARQITQDAPPRLLLLTGGASRMTFFREACQEAFPDAALVCCPEPECSIARGLAYAGRVDAMMAAFRAEISALLEGGLVERTVRERLPGLARPLSAWLSQEMIERAALPVIDEWRNGRIERLSALDSMLAARIEQVLSQEEARAQLTAISRTWTEGVLQGLQSQLLPICARYSVPAEDMRLTNVAALPNPAVTPDMPGAFALDYIGTLVALIAGLIAGTLCGGSGVALVAAGPMGWLAGAILAMLAAFVGWTSARSLLRDANLPRPVRKLVPRSVLAWQMRGKQDELARLLLASFSDEQGDFAQKLCASVSSSLKDAISRLVDEAQMQLE